MSRILAVMGSGETTPTMTRHHRRLFDAAGSGRRVLVDSPYGFQENADDITARALEYFRVSLSSDVEAIELRRPDSDARTVALALDAVRRAPWVFTGPGSPTYAMRVWRSVGLAPVLAARLAPGSASVTVFSSAASLTLGAACVPVYEIYKVGEEPHWVEGLDVFHAATGLDAVVIPHFDNAEGGSHDTRFCYLGERRLRAMEAELPSSTWVLGIDEHTVVLFDLDTATVEVAGRGALTVRSRTASVRFESGAMVPIDALRHAALGATPASPPAGSAPPTGAGAGTATPAAAPADADASLIEAALAAEACFDAAIAAGDPGRAVDEALGLEAALEQWKGDTSTTDERDRSRHALHRMVARLGQLAVEGTRDPAEILGPVIRVALEQRTRARSDRDFARSDAIRDALGAAGVEVRDTPQGQYWTLVTREQTTNHEGPT